MSSNNTYTLTCNDANVAKVIATNYGKLPNPMTCTTTPSQSSQKSCQGKVGGVDTKIVSGKTNKDYMHYCDCPPNYTMSKNFTLGDSYNVGINIGTSTLSTTSKCILNTTVPPDSNLNCNDATNGSTVIPYNYYENTGKNYACCKDGYYLDTIGNCQTLPGTAAVPQVTGGYLCPPNAMKAADGTCNYPQGVTGFDMNGNPIACSNGYALNIKSTPYACSTYTLSSSDKPCDPSQNNCFYDGSKVQTCTTRQYYNGTNCINLPDNTLMVDQQGNPIKCANGASYYKLPDGSSPDAICCQRGQYYNKLQSSLGKPNKCMNLPPGTFAIDQKDPKSNETLKCKNNKAVVPNIATGDYLCADKSSFQVNTSCSVM
jgi:hypothetical protein